MAVQYHLFCVTVFIQDFRVLPHKLC
uniref:Uncharacterized protein n=1 Tax=Arundo donax TaxID=35708 RepID=A0A0A9ADU8_ARUDO